MKPIEYFKLPNTSDAHMVNRGFDLQDRLGAVTLLINNAGVGGPIGPTWEVSATEWWRTMEVNLRGILLWMDVMEANQWPPNLGSERDWAFQGQPNPHVNNRSIFFSMGKVLGGGSSINLMTWARGHKSDWDFFASEAGDPAWNYESVLQIYRRIEDWHGAPDP